MDNTLYASILSDSVKTHDSAKLVNNTAKDNAAKVANLVKEQQTATRSAVTETKIAPTVMNDTSFMSILNDNLLLREDMLSLLRAASEDKKKRDAEIQKQTAAAANQTKTQALPAKPALDAMDGDNANLEPIANSSLISTDDANGAATTNGSKLYNDLAPEAMVANSIITAIYNSFVNNCDNNKKMNDYFDQVKNWEKQARGACQQIMSIIEASNFDTTNTANCSPKAYKTIVNYNSRDRSAVDLCAAIIIFRNSLKKD